MNAGRRLVARLLIVAIIISAFSTTRVLADVSRNAESESSSYELGFIEEAEKTYKVNTEKLSKEQLNSLAMLNYLTVLTQEINSAKNNRVYLENVYSSIVNNVNPDVVDRDSYDQIMTLLNTIHAYTMIDVKRERLQYIYDQNQAVSFKRSLPSPLVLLNYTASTDILKSIAGVIYMAVNSVDNYKSYATDTEQKYLESGWDLDDEASNALHASRRDAFAYMLDMCQDNRIPGKLALNEVSVKDFVTWENSSSVIRRIEFLEKNVETYQGYGRYWLVLAHSYYDNGEYGKCLQAITAYETMGIDTFRKNHEYAKALSFAIVAASYELDAGRISEEQYLKLAEKYLEGILDNIERTDWDLRYFVAQTYVDLASKTPDNNYLRTAFELAKENINYMVDEQRKRNSTYLTPVKTLAIDKKKDSKATQAEKESYNDLLKEERSKELPPVSEALVLNCELLFAIAEEIDIPDEEKHRVDEIIHQGGTRLFYVDQFDESFWLFKPESYYKTKFQLPVKNDFGKLTIEIPARLLYQGSGVYVRHTHLYSSNYYKATLDSVDRKKNLRFDDFTVKYHVDKFFDLPLADGDRVSIIIYTEPDAKDSIYRTKIATYTVDAKQILMVKDIKLVPGR